MTQSELTVPRRAAGASGLGRFRWDTVADTWWWSDEMFRLYGYEPGAVEPSLDRFLQHKDPRDMARVDAVFTRCLAEGGPFSCYHRIRDTRGRTKTVVAVGSGTRDDADTRTVVMEGFLVDVSAGTRTDAEAALQAVLATRAGIEQVKGAIMLVHGLEADAAFDLLRGYSQVYNKKIVDLVAAVLVAFRARASSETVRRSELDTILWDAAR